MYTIFVSNAFISHCNSHKQYISHISISDFPKKPCTLEGFKPGSSILQADAITAAPCLQGTVNMLSSLKVFCPRKVIFCYLS
jgi:hypothetical protein